MMVSFKDFSPSSIWTTKFFSTSSSLWGKQVKCQKKVWKSTHIVKEVGYVLPVTGRQSWIKLDVPVLADEVVRADLREDEVEHVLRELAHQLHRQLVGDEEVAVGEHVREAAVQTLVLWFMVVVVPQDVGNLDVVIPLVDMSLMCLKFWREIWYLFSVLGLHYQLQWCHHVSVKEDKI